VGEKDACFIELPVTALLKFGSSANSAGNDVQIATIQPAVASAPASANDLARR